MLTLMFIVFAVLGCGYVIVAAFLGHFGDSGDGHGHDGHDAHGHAEFHFPFFSPLAVATLLAAVGSYGLIVQQGFGASETVSLLVAIPAALATTYAVTYVGWRLASSSQGSSMIRMEQLRGAPAEVTVPIAAGGVGEAAALLAGGHRYTAPAREANGRAVPRGAAVTVVDLLGTTLVVAWPAEGPPKGA